MTAAGTPSRPVPLDAPAAAAGQGAFRAPQVLGREPVDATTALRASPAGRAATPISAGAVDLLGPVPRSAVIDRLRQLYVGAGGFEGSFDYLYVDSEGHVTVGVGHLSWHSKDSEAKVRERLAAIPLVHTTPGRGGCSGPAHEACKYQAAEAARARYQAQFQAVLKRGVEHALANQLDPFAADSPGTARAMFGAAGDPTAGRNKLDSKAYAKPPAGATEVSDLRLPPGAALTLLQRDLEAHYELARRNFSQLASLPFDAQLVIVDVLFNGTHVGGKGGWGRFKTAVQCGDWGMAARNCEAGKDPRRDLWRRDLLGALARLQRLGSGAPIDWIA